MRRIWKKICPICGSGFNARTSTAKYCPKCRAMGNSVRQRLLNGGKALCANCGKEFEGHGNALFCSETCHNAWELRQRRMNCEAASRSCHDCGKPTSDYRCPVCQKKFRQRYNVSPEASCPEAWLYA